MRGTFQTAMIVVLALPDWGCSSCSGTSTTGDAIADGAVDSADVLLESDAGDPPEECYFGDTCIPFSWSCDGDGRPVECSAHGDAWIPRAPCNTGQTCDPETGWCNCGPCVLNTESCWEIGASALCHSMGVWVGDGECGCAPVFPGCPDDEIADMEGGCQHVGARDDCGTGTWGTIPAGSGTIYVDASYSGGGSDGTSGRPFTSIQAAVDAIPTSATAPRLIAIAAGTYAESVVSDRPAELHGRCPSMVTIRPPSTSDHGVLMSGAPGSVISLTVDGGGGTGIGLIFRDGSGYHARDVVIHSTIDAGVSVAETTAVIEYVSIHDIDAAGVSTAGHGIRYVSETSPSTNLVVRSVDVRSVGGYGLSARGTVSEITDSRFTDSGMGAIVTVATHDSTIMELTGNRISGAHGIGIEVLEDVGVTEHVIVLGNVIADIQVATPWDGGTQSCASFRTSSRLEMVHNVFESSDVGGVVVQDAEEFLFNDNVIRDVNGYGLEILDAFAAMAEMNTIRNTVGAGIVERRSVLGLMTDMNTIAGVAPADSSSTSSGIEFHDSESPGVQVSIISGADYGIVFHGSTMGAHAFNNLIEANLVGIAAYDLGEWSGVTIEGNNILDAAVGIQVRNSGGGDSLIQYNRIGPLTRELGDAEDRLYRIGMHLVDIDGTVHVESNDVVLGAPTSPDLWSEGIVLQGTAGEIRENRVSGFEALGILLSSGERTDDGPYVVMNNVVVGGSGVGILVLRPLLSSSVQIEDNRVAGIGATAWPDGGSFGDGIALVTGYPDGLADLVGNQLLVNARTGFFASEFSLGFGENEILGNQVSYAVQDAAVAHDFGDNELDCNESDEPWIDTGMSVPRPLLYSFPVP